MEIQESLHALVLVCICSITLGSTDWETLGRKKIQDALKKQQNNGVAKNVILFIGDGMGMSTITAARIYKGQQQGQQGEETVFTYEDFPDVALSKVYGTDRQVPDSAQTATAMMSGYKTNWFILGAKDGAKMDNCESLKGQEVPSILHKFIADGRSTGVISTARITHATPAAAYAHSVNRYWEGDADLVNVTGGCKDLAHQLIYDNNDIQVILGGGRRQFLPKDVPDPKTNKMSNKRTDNVNLIDVWGTIQRSKNRNHQYIWNREQFDALDPSKTDYLLGLLSPSHLQYEIERNSTEEPSVAELTAKAIQILKRNPKGFFLMVEGARIDHAHHDSTARRALAETVALEEAVKEAVRLTDTKDTLIIVTADHSHVFNMGGYPYKGNDILGLSHPLMEEPTTDGLPYTTLSYGNGPGFHLYNNRTNLSAVDTRDKDYIQESAVPMAYETHGGEDVAIYAKGPMSHLFHGVQENTHVAYVMQYAACLGIYKQNCDRPQTDTDPNNAPNICPSLNFISILCLIAVVKLFTVILH